MTIKGSKAGPLGLRALQLSASVTGQCNCAAGMHMHMNRTRILVRSQKARLVEFWTA